MHAWPACGANPVELACWWALAVTPTQAVAEAVAVALARACTAALMSPWQAVAMDSAMAVATAFLASLRVPLLPVATALTTLSMAEVRQTDAAAGDQ